MVAATAVALLNTLLATVDDAALLHGVATRTLPAVLACGRALPSSLDVATAVCAYTRRATATPLSDADAAACVATAVTAAATHANDGRIASFAVATVLHPLCWPVSPHDAAQVQRLVSTAVLDGVAASGNPQLSRRTGRDTPDRVSSDSDRLARVIDTVSLLTQPHMSSGDDVAGVTMSLWARLIADAAPDSAVASALSRQVPTAVDALLSAGAGTSSGAAGTGAVVEAALCFLGDCVRVCPGAVVQALVGCGAGVRRQLLAVVDDFAGDAGAERSRRLATACVVLRTALDAVNARAGGGAAAK